MTENEQTQVTSLPTRADLAASGLSNKNQEFMAHVLKMVTDEAKQAPLVAEVQEKLLEGQRSGQTARQIYGTPAEALGLAAKERTVDARPTSAIYASYPLWMLSVDNMMAFLMMFAAMFGIMGLASSSTMQAGTAAGIVSLIMTALIGGFAFAVVSKIMASTNVSRFVKFSSAIAIFFVWFGLYMLLAMLPKAINPVLPAWFYIALAVLVFVVFRVWRTRTKIVGGFLGGATRPTK
jgi:uncharacterized membrane-anchored protein